MTTPISSGVPGYQLALPRRVIFGWGCRAELAGACRALSQRVVLVATPSMRARPIVDGVLEGLHAEQITVDFVPAPTREPLVEDIDELAAAVRSLKLSERDILLAIGGGSTLDATKAVAGLAGNPHIHSVIDLLEGVGTGATFEQPPRRWVAVPTTAGTGSEATRNAVISSRVPPFKKSVRDARLMAELVLIDPEFTTTLSPSVTAATGMDAITQLLEAGMTRKGNPVTRALCEEGLRAAWPALPIAFQNSEDRPAREALSHAAFLSGVALANSGLGLAHGVAAGLGAMTPIAHGVACAVMLPWAVEFNAPAAGAWLARMARELGIGIGLGDGQAIAMLGESIRTFLAAMGLPARLRELDVSRDMLPALVEASQGNSLSGNPVALDRGQLLSLLQRAW